MNTKQIEEIKAIIKALEALIEENLKYEREKAHKEYLDSITPVFDPEPPLPPFPDGLKAVIELRECSFCGKKTTFEAEKKPCCRNCYEENYRIDQ